MIELILGKKLIFTLILWILVFNAGIVRASSSSGHAVFDLLFTNSNYNKDVRPVRDWKTLTLVNCSLSVIAIVDFNEVKQTIILTSKLTLVWKDEYLVWDASQYENLTHIHAPQSMVWKPSIFLENSIAKQEEFGTSSAKVVIASDGSVQWEPVEVFHATCAADVRKFPFDTQRCSMVFEAMGYAGNEMQIISVEDHIGFHGYGGNSGWTVTQTHMEVEKGYEGKSHLVCSVTMSRNPVYFILNIFLPIVLLTFMNICVFILPVQSGEKASFVITVFLSLAVFLTIVSSNLPENSDTVALLNIYVFISTLLSVIIAIITLIQIKLYHKHDLTPVPNVLKKIVYKFRSKVSCKTNTPVVMFEENGSVTKGDRRTSIMSIKDIDEKQPHENTNVQTNSNSMLVTWPDVARAFDNLFLLIFLTINIIMTTAIFVLAVRNEEVVQEDRH